VHIGSPVMVIHALSAGVLAVTAEMRCAGLVVESPWNMCNLGHVGFVVAAAHV
jgi:hypothetical protein